ncbi:MAG: hypothetical protein KAS07_06050 [Candidatus Pacebacteria bacterium]|nr:hypothetical protein [Candidatus Paceibacterota bacterium]
MMQKIAIKDDFLKTVFGIEILGITELDGEITLSFFGSGHRDIVIQTNPLSETGSGSIITQEVFDAKVKEFEDLL